MRKSINGESGFTLIEVIIVMIVTGILSSIAVPIYRAQQHTAVKTSVQSDLKNISTFMEDYQVSHDGYYPDIIPDGSFTKKSENNTLRLAPTHSCIEGVNSQYTDILMHYDAVTKKISDGACPEGPPPEAEPIPTPPADPVIIPIGGGTVSTIVDAAVYVGTPVAFTNEWKMIGNGADLYVDGDFECNSQVTIAGDVIVEGNAYMTNTCYVGGNLWVAGTTRLDSTAKIMGTLNSVGNVSFQSTSKIIMNVNTNGTFTSTDGKTVAQLNAMGSIGGTVNTNVAVIVPKNATFPKADYKSSSTPMPITWSNWIKSLANPTPTAAPAGYGPASGAGCSLDTNQTWALTGPIRVMTNTIVDARQETSGCSSLTIGSGGDIRLSADLTIYASGFSASNGIKVTSADGIVHTIRIIVPSTTGIAKCVNTNKIDLGSNSMFDTNTTSLVYTDSKIVINGTTTMNGQIIGGCVNGSGSIIVNYRPVSIP